MSPEEREVVLEKARENGGQLFWRVRAKGEDGRIVCSGFREMVFEKLLLPKRNQRKKINQRLIK